jgi:hypothetical protein
MKNLDTETVGDMKVHTVKSKVNKEEEPVHSEKVKDLETKRQEKKNNNTKQTKDKTKKKSFQKSLWELSKISIIENSYTKKKRSDENEDDWVYEKISNFIINPIKHLYMCIDDKYVTQTFIEIIKDNGTKINKTIKGSMFKNEQIFTDIIGEHPDLWFTCNKTQIKAIGDYVYNHVGFPTKQATDKTGLQKINDKWAFVAGTKAIDLNFNDIDVELLEDKDKIDSSILTNEFITVDELKALSKHLFKINNNVGMIAINLSWAINSLVKAYYDGNNINLNYNTFIGESGAGKTSFVEAFIVPLMSLICDEKTIGYNMGLATNFVLIAKCVKSHSFPLILDEYKPSKWGQAHKDMVSGIFRNAYNGYGVERGNKQQKINSYRIIAPLIILGEDSINETAVKERSLISSICKKDLEGTEEAYKFIKNNRNLLSKLGLSLLKKAFDYIKDDKLIDVYKQEEEKAKELFENPRIYSSIALTRVGLLILEDAYKDLGLNFVDETGYTIEQLNNEIHNVIFKDMLEGENVTKTKLDYTLEALFEMLYSDNEQKDEFRKFANLKDYIIARDDKFKDNILLINIPLLDFEFIKRTRNIPDYEGYSTLKEFSRHLNKSGVNKINGVEYIDYRYYITTDKKACYKILNLTELKKKNVRVDLLDNFFICGADILNVTNGRKA